MKEFDFDSFIENLIQKFGFPEPVRMLKVKREEKKRMVIEEIFLNILDSYKASIRWWVLRFKNGKIYIVEGKNN
jgi:hypothetical protein